jgi:CheY-like chemotaxis protein
MSGLLLCVGPDADSRAETAAALREATDREVVECPDRAAAVGALAPSVDAVVTAFDLPDGTGVDLLEPLRDAVPDAAFVLFTDADPAVVEEATPADAVMEYVPKGLPGAHEELARLVAHSVDQRTQTAYPLPDDEDGRLAALAAYEPVLEATEPAAERLTRLASDLLDVPMAAVGIVDEDAQSFVACYGVEFGVLAREDTVCTHAVLEEAVTTIPDLATDPRFEGNAELQGTDLRAYASANLTTPGGDVVGTFCAYDEFPREWTDADREHLRLLAAEAMEALELRRRLHEADAGEQPGDHTPDIATTNGGEPR